MEVRGEELKIKTARDNLHVLSTSGSTQRSPHPKGRIRGKDKHYLCMGRADPRNPPRRKIPFRQGGENGAARKRLTYRRGEKKYEIKVAHEPQ